MSILSNDELLGGPPQDLFDGAVHLVRAGYGVDLEARTNAFTVEEMCQNADDAALAMFLIGCWAHLKHLESRDRTIPIPSEEFEKFVNRILAADKYPQKLRDGAWVPTVASDAELLYRTLLANPDDAAEFKQGDIQIEMVASTVQERLSRPGTVLVDYGVGLGRVLLGLATAGHFKNVTYVAVDEPIHVEAKSLAGRIGAKAEFLSRSEFLTSKKQFADVLMVVNTLHHIPFADLAKQLTALLSALKPSGVLLVHEMAELRDPEQLNVPWRAEDILLLFNTPLLKKNLRTTTSKGKKVPITNLLVEVAAPGEIAAALEVNVRAVWEQMKARTLDNIRDMYQSRNPEQHIELQHALITNANLDLTKP